MDLPYLHSIIEPLIQGRPPGPSTLMTSSPPAPTTNIIAINFRTDVNAMMPFSSDLTYPLTEIVIIHAV